MHTQISFVYSEVAKESVGATCQAICGRVAHENVYKHGVKRQPLTLFSPSSSAS